MSEACEEMRHPANIYKAACMHGSTTCDSTDIAYDSASRFAQYVLKNTAINVRHARVSDGVTFAFSRNIYPFLSRSALKMTPTTHTFSASV